MSRRAAAEPMLPLDCRQRRPRRGGWKWRPSETREDPQFYRAVVYLRHIGRPVYRSGNWHKVNGAYADRGQLLALAVSL
jgi:hypothetical protein